MFGAGVFMDDNKKDEKKGKEWNECLGPECSWMMTRRMKRRAKSGMNVWFQSVHG
jgi:hypothetical protein